MLINSKAYEEAVLKGITRAKTEMKQHKKPMKWKKTMSIAASVFQQRVSIKLNSLGSSSINRGLIT